MKPNSKHLFQFDELKNLATCRRLAEVDFGGNPLTKQNRYRDNVIINVAELVCLDGKDSFFDKNFRTTIEGISTKIKLIIGDKNSHRISLQTKEIS